MKLSLISTSTKVAACAIAALAMSVGFNIHQAYSHYFGRKVETAQAVAAGFAKAAKVNRDIAETMTKDHGELVADLAIIVERGRKERVVYAKAAAAKPLAAVCAPGAARVNAVNSGADR